MDITTQPRSRLRAVLLIVVAVLAGVVVSACGGDSDSESATQKQTGNGIDRAFADEMVPHHESAVEMAEIAKQRGESTFVKNLADDIIRTQNEEITTLRSISARLDEAGVKPKSLGMAEDEMGMDSDMSELRNANPFDKAFIDMMIPHHQAAIRMARVELAKGSDAKAKQLATAIIDAQAREIRAMNKHRTEEFGAASPAGGVPAESEEGMEGMSDDEMSSME